MSNAREHEAPPVNPHDWIQRNPDYLIPPARARHCCGMEHCRPAPAGMVTRIPGGYAVAAYPPWVTSARTFKAADVYQAEEPGPEGQEFWVCGLGGAAVCLFVPPLGF